MLRMFLLPGIARYKGTVYFSIREETLNYTWGKIGAYLKTNYGTKQKI